MHHLELVERQEAAGRSSSTPVTAHRGIFAVQTSFKWLEQAESYIYIR